MGVSPSISSGPIATLSSFGGKLYAGDLSGRLWVSVDGMAWRSLNNAYPIGSGTGLYGLVPFNNNLYGGLSGRVYQVSPVNAGLTGTDGTTAAQTLTATGLDLVPSTNSVVCGGVSPCAATNQVLFTATDLAGNTKTFGPFAIQASTAPLPIAPSGFAGTAQSKSSILWTWNDDASNQAGYRVMSGTVSLSGDLAPSATYWLQTSLSTNKLYGPYFVRAFNGGVAADSESASRYTLAAAPSGLAANGWTGGVSLTWSSSANPAGTVWDLRRSPDGQSYASIYTSTVTRWYNDTGLALAATYFYEVVALNGDGVDSPPNGPLPVYLPLAPSAPTAFQAQAVGPHVITWRWADNSSGQASYRVMSGTADISGYLPAGSVQWDQTGLVANTLMGPYFVHAFNISGTADSNPPVSQYTAPESAQSMSASYVGISSAVISWTTVDNLPGNTVWDLERSEDGSNYAPVPVSNGVLSYADTSLSADTTYYYKIQGSNDGGSITGYFGPITVFTNGVTPIPIPTPAYPGNGAYVNVQPDFDWIGLSTTTAAGLSPGSLFYLQVANNDPGFSDANIVISSATSAVVASTLAATADGAFISTFTLPDATTFYWRVASFDGTSGAFGPWSQVYSFVTDLAAPVQSGAFSFGAGLTESQISTLASGVTVQIGVQDLESGLAVSPAALPFAGDGHNGAGFTTGFGVRYSTDAGRTWTDASAITLSSAPGMGAGALAVFNGMLFAANTAANGRVFVSSDGTSWSATNGQIAAMGSSICALVPFDGKLYAGGGTTGKVYVTADANKWSATNGGAAVGSGIRALTVFNGELYVGDASGRIYVTADGAAWKAVSAGRVAGWPINALIPFNGRLYAGDAAGWVYSSADGHAWGTTNYGAKVEIGGISSLAVYNGKLYASGNSDWVKWSADGNNWNATGDWGGVALTAYNGKLYAANSGQIEVTADGQTWSGHMPTAPGHFTSLTVFNGMLYAGDQYSGAVWRISPVAATLSGTDGTTSAQSLTATGLNLVSSTNAVTCGGVSPCTATNQVVFTASDLAGNVLTAGPYAVLVDTVGPTATLTALVASGDSITAWASAGGSASGLRDFNFELSTSASFGAGESSSDFVTDSNFTFTGLQAGTTYYARVTARDQLLNLGPASPVLSTMTVPVAAANLYVSAADVAPAAALQGSHVPVLHLTFQTDPGLSTTWSSLRVLSTGTAQDSDIGAVQVYADAGGTGVFDPVADPLVGAGVVSAGSSLVTFATPPAVRSTPSSYFIVYHLSAVSTVGATVGAVIASTADIAFASPFAAVGPLAAASGLVTIQDSPSYLNFSASSLAPSLASPGALDVPILKLNASVFGKTSQIDRMILSLVGTLPSDQVAAVRVYRDSNGNGVLDGGDLLLTSGADRFIDGTAVLTFTASQAARTIAGSTATLFVAVDLAAAAPPGAAFSLQLAAPSVVTLAGPGDMVSFGASPLASNSTTVSNTVAAAFSSALSSTVRQGDSYVVLQATLAVNAGTARLTGLAVDRTGVSSDGDISAVQVYQKAVLDDAPFDPAVDLLLGGGTFTNGHAAIALSPVAVTAGTPSVLFIVYSISPAAGPGNTVGASLASADSLQFADPFTVASGSFPAAGPSPAIGLMVNQLIVTAAEPDPAPLLQGATGVVLIRLDARSNRSVVPWLGLELLRLGTAPDSDIPSVQVWHDADGDGKLTGADQLVSSGHDVFAAGQARVAFTDAQAIGTSSQTFFVAVAVSPDASPGDTLGVRIVDPSAFSLVSPHVLSTGTPSFPIGASPATVVQYPNTITVTAAGFGPASPVNAGTSDVGLVKLTLQTNVSKASWSKLHLDRAGISSDSDVRAVKLYYDVNQLGYFDSSNVGQYQLLSSTGVTFGSILPGSTDIWLAPPMTLSAAPRTFFVAVDLSTAAPPGDSVGVRVADPSYLVVAWPNSVAPVSFTSNLATVSLPPSLMDVTAADTHAPLAAQGTVSVPMLSLRLHMRRYSAEWSGLTVTRTGTALDADVPRMRLYADTPGTGVFDPLADTLVATGTFSGGQATLSFSPVTVLSVSTAAYFVAYDVSALAVSGRTFGAQLPSPGAFALAAPNSAASAGFPFATAATLISPTVTGVTASAVDAAPGSVLQGAAVQPLLSLTLATTDHAALWNAIQLTRTGTASDTDIDAVHVFLDANNNGIVDFGDTEVTSGADRFLNGVANIALTAPQPVSASPAHYLITADVDMFARPAATLGVQVAAAAALAVAAPNFVVDSGFPMSSSIVPIAKRSDTLWVNTTVLLTADVIQSREAPVFKIQAHAGRDRVTWSGLNVSWVGDLPASQVDFVALYADGGRGVFNSSARLVATGTLSGVTASLAFPAQTISVATSTFWLTFRPNLNAPPGATVGMAFGDAGSFVVAVPDTASGVRVQTNVFRVLDSKTPTQPIVTLPAGAASGATDSMEFVWSSTVALGGLASARYAIGTAPGASDVQGWTALQPQQTDVRVSPLQLFNGTTYYVAVKTTSEFGFTSSIGSSIGQIVDGVKPSKPHSSVTNTGASVQIDWTPATTGPSGLRGYLIEYNLLNAPEWMNAKTKTTSALARGLRPSDISDNELVASPPYQATGLPAGTLQLRVSAVSGANVISDPSALSVVQYGALPQGGITNVSIFPNPFDSRTTAATIVYDLASPSDMELEIFDAFGGRVRDMRFGAGSTGGRAGTNAVTWDGADDGGRKVSMGLYVYVLRGGGAKVAKKVAVIH
ncbi:MAG: hypothetical protein NTX64_12220 [Elusimicrobia bacterium]|nr:hypothetical protein [Elusimicrobiota bacterium]